MPLCNGGAKPSLQNNRPERLRVLPCKSQNSCTECRACDALRVISLIAVSLATTGSNQTLPSSLPRNVWPALTTASPAMDLWSPIGLTGRQRCQQLLLLPSKPAGAMFQNMSIPPNFNLSRDRQGWLIRFDQKRMSRGQEGI
ncbi:MAG: hypothetical protein JWM91_4760 [Rhodospirillales bacterium]|nr:hypothetical protein [Rhodospirillales bacterium]